MISFYSGDRYYYDAADNLRADCEKFGLDCDIVELEKKPEETWLDLCRKKVPFYLAMQRKHKRPLLWIDVDCRLLQRPDFLEGLRCDMAGYLRGFKYIKGFDPMSFARFFQPSILLFNHTPRACAFVELMARLEEESTVPGTDDYFLQEAWEKFEDQLSLFLLPPATISFDWPALGEQTFYFGRSGNVAEFKGKAQQHDVDLYTPTRRKAVFLREALELGKAKKPMEALQMLRKAFHIDPTDEALAYRMARLLRREGKLKAALLFLRRFQGGNSGVNHARRFLADSELEAGNVERANELVRDLVARGSAQDIAWAQSRLLRIGLEQRASATQLQSAQRPALWWMESPYPGNFGDILNPYIVEKLSGKPPRLVPKGKGMLAIGSIIKFAVEGTAVWGSGTPRMSDRLNPKADYRAVRGPLTRQLALESGGTCPEVYGDVAWFLPRLYQPNPAARRYKLGLIRHFANDEDLGVGEGVKIISVIRSGYEGIEQFIDELHECECILTTSLHGLIVSHAYGIPARWCEVPDSLAGLPGDGTKFYDYMLSVGMDQEPPLALPRGSVVGVELVSEAQRLPIRQIDLEALSAAAPFEIVYPWRDCEAARQHMLTPLDNKLTVSRRASTDAATIP
ncbi:hypothetical protein Bpro_4932 (plasmid) [Polaromonas sp. JS666]|nr:hypothetical protein Bpro_4932 [Polaromonas sp. JS666]